MEPDAEWVDVTTVHKGGLFGTDYRMLFPGDGIEAAVAIRRERPRLPVVFYSIQDDDAYYRAFRQAGILSHYAYVRKSNYLLPDMILPLLRDAIAILRRIGREESIDPVYFGGLRSGTDAAKAIEYIRLALELDDQVGLLCEIAVGQCEGFVRKPDAVVAIRASLQLSTPKPRQTCRALLTPSSWNPASTTSPTNRSWLPNSTVWTTRHSMKATSSRSLQTSMRSTSTTGGKSAPD